MSREYLKEAYNVLNHINNLTRMLSSIRKPYLNVDSDTNPLSRPSTSKLDLSSSEQGWSSIRHLTNEERDQIDLQARVILSKCANRVKDMETLEKRRAELAAKDSNLLLRLLPARLKNDPSTAASANLSAHHASITNYLNKRLADASQSQKEMQEERIKRQSERARTLGSGAARAAVELTSNDTLAVRNPPSTAGQRSWLGDASRALSSGLAATMDAPSHNRPASRPPLPAAGDDWDDEYDDDEDLELSSSQIQQFETENANILRSVQDTLASVQQAESRLLDISALQMELVTHLTRQTELTDQLYDDAIASTATVDKGNVQLKEARRRSKDSRLYILVFLFGASFALLFLHYY
ncbi:hypothetical protein BD410DRAFT_709616 [Rickenella mellea]|uniref:t-SNARE coiled-coil homology domain-containing protein n=1 Tax=Rickenella mellea TaxID=50990 RepID=A0A4R5XEA8_9AGAM|nr:hypothetical protein BD410DRAFT_709616 [Rickenella mellea]